MCEVAVLIAPSESFYGVLKSRAWFFFFGVSPPRGVASDFIAQLMGRGGSVDDDAGDCVQLM